MFNALSGLGGGGKQDATTADNGNVRASALFSSPTSESAYADPLPTPSSQVALYSTFAVFGFFGGSIMNRIGARLTLSIGALGYSLCESLARFWRGVR